ncbi:hypothetical protein BDY17DRAFT_14303 [Neohortaea acidophila]|uniref:NAD(P)-binding domain-containing protein n=1 Tax=Neohortaea acidophila TaxID=245834 RepID=A0A6A6Q6C0_9PEZI|nr:uncharacterized protein BDY17DRAFT_14303 [Neohortaea acidophila]KAF2487589.1 hypothetical protein BDY17DRAFT_14303 [Neohortaea acidophila]
MHILVFGGTGAVGLSFVQEALKAGHRLTLYVRSPSKLPKNVQQNINVHIVEGDFSDMEAVKKALNDGADVLVSFVGPAIPNKGMAITEFYDKLFPLLPTDSTIKRCFVLSTASYSAPEDRRSLKWWFGILAIKLFLGTAYKEINGMSRAVTSLPTEQVEWTLFRVPGLTNSEAKPVRAGFIGDGKSDGIFISRGSIAVWILQELEERRWVNKAPSLCNVGWL